MYHHFPRRYRHLTCAALLVGAFILLPVIVFGAESTTSTCRIKLQIALPGLGNCVSDLKEYLRAIYVFVISICGALAVAVIVNAGFGWMFAGGSPEKVNKAKGEIVGALTGIFFALFSYAMLNTLNPDITKLQISGLDDGIENGTQINNGTPAVCPGELNVQCGFQTTFFPAGGTKPVSCVGTWCSASFVTYALGTGADSVCQLSYNAVGDITGGGCVQQVSIANAGNLPVGNWAGGSACGEYTQTDFNNDCTGLSENTCFFLGTTTTAGINMHAANLLPKIGTDKDSSGANITAVNRFYAGEPVSCPQRQAKEWCESLKESSNKSYCDN